MVYMLLIYFSHSTLVRNNVLLKRVCSVVNLLGEVKVDAGNTVCKSGRNLAIWHSSATVGRGSEREASCTGTMEA